MTTTVDQRYAGVLRLDGKRALITGATKGIGADIARAFASAGASLVLSGRNSDELAAAQSCLTDGDGDGDRNVAQGFEFHGDQPVSTIELDLFAFSVEEA